MDPHSGCERCSPTMGGPGCSFNMTRWWADAAYATRRVDDILAATTVIGASPCPQGTSRPHCLRCPACDVHDGGILDCVEAVDEATGELRAVCACPAGLVPLASWDDPVLRCVPSVAWQWLEALEPPEAAMCSTETAKLVADARPVWWAVVPVVAMQAVVCVVALWLKRRVHH